MKHFISIILTLVLAAGLACAAQLPTPYPAPYWINGILRPSLDPQAPTPDNFQVIIYKDPALLANGGDGTYRYLTGGAYATGTTGQIQADGTAIFTINLYDDPNMGPLSTTNTYYIGAVTKNGYGVNETLVPIHAPGVGYGGYSLVDLTLELGGIPPIEPPSDVPLGTVPLQIARATDGSNNIIVSWVNTIGAYQNPQIFVLQGDGTGKYTNEIIDNNWKPIAQSGLNTDGIDAAGLADGEVRISKQVGTGIPELYFKAIQAELLPTDLSMDLDFPGKTVLATAWPVGKLDVALAGNGLTMMGSPFNSGSLSSAFAGQVPAGQELWIYPRNGTGLSKSTISSAGISGDDFALTPAKGFWLRNTSSNAITITLVGALSILADQHIAYNLNLETPDLSANPLGLPITGALLGGSAGDWLYPQSGTGLSKIERSADGWGNYTLGFTNGFWYRSFDALGRRWQINPNDQNATIGVGR